MVQTPPKPIVVPTLALNLPPALRLIVTPEQFEALAASNRELRLERTAQGELIVNPPTGWQTGERNSGISGELYLWWRNAGEPGKVFESSTGFKLPNGANRSPDASWVSQARWDALTPEQKGTFAEICPDFVVELRSESDTVKGLQAKMAEYLANGAQLGWLLNPKKRTVEVYRPDKAVEILENPATVSGEPVLSGFVLDLKRVWG
ncbi:MAG: Uma2 family endonuclease [Spirulina sp. SIO3F2]|nr:Uma2 family endonuclease [Spirulina sp. SIO3F2]